MSSESWNDGLRRLRGEILGTCRRMYANKLIAATDGNVSVRVAEDELLITRSGISKGDAEEEDILRVDFDGNVLEGRGRPSSEIRMHLACYEERPDIAAVVHAHPPTAVAFTLAGKTLAQCIIPEVVVTLGAVPTLPYTTPTTEAVPLAVRRVIRHADALMLERHGAVTVGRSAMDAYYKLEKLEHAAHVTWLAHQLGRVKTLPADEVRRLLALRSSTLLDGKNPLCNECVLACHEGLEGA
ncbi:MAG TPA: class II aldolase/adducin family protein [Planctomycetes bacterium]|nr:class II aldolase/adducin family protein [Planctomycetota bacterium]